MTLAEIAKAMAHPARIAILQELLTNKKCQCGDLVKQLDLAQSTISQHLKELKHAGLITGKIEGDRPCYCLSSELLPKLITFLKGLQATAEKQDNTCC